MRDADGVRHGNDPAQSRSIRITVDENAEETAYWKLHPSVRRMLQDSPYEFSTGQAQALWEYCAGTLDSLATFRRQLELNVADIRRKERELGIGPDIQDFENLPKYSLRAIEEEERVDDILQGVPDAFDMYAVAPSRLKPFREPS